MLRFFTASSLFGGLALLVPITAAAQSPPPFRLPPAMPGDHRPGPPSSPPPQRPSPSPGSAPAILNPPTTAPVPRVNPTPAFIAPPPHPEPPIPTRVSPPIAMPSGRPDPAVIRALTPDVEVWRTGGSRPQLPIRNGDHFNRVYVTGNQPTLLRLQFDPSVRGKSVAVSRGKGVRLAPPEQVLKVKPNGECVVSVFLQEGVQRSHVSFYCEGLTTALPLVRATESVVEANEDSNGGGRP